MVFQTPALASFIVDTRFAATEYPAYVELSLDGQRWSDSKREYSIVGDAAAIRVVTNTTSSRTQQSQNWLLFDPIEVIVVDSVLPEPQGHPLLEHDTVERSITAVVYFNGAPVSVNGSVTKTTKNGHAYFGDLRVYKPKVGTYSVNFTTPGIVTPASLRTLRVSAWQTGLGVSVVEGVVSGLEVRTTPEPSILINTEPFTTQPIIILKDVADNQVYDASGVLVTAAYEAFVYGYSCTSDWNISSPYYPCIADFQTERIVMSDGAYHFESLKLVGYHNMSYRIRFYVVEGTSTETIQDAYSQELTVGGCTGALALKFETGCLACPANGKCDGSITMLSSGNVWRPTNRSHTWYACEQTEACLSDTETGDCKEGYLNGSVLCAVCDEGYAFDAVGGKCRKCASTEANIALVIVVLIGVYLLFCFLISSNIRSKYNEMFPMYVKQMVNHMQFVAILSTFQVEYPDFLESVFVIQKVTAGNSGGFNAFECLIYDESEGIRRFWYHMLFPVIAVVMCFVSIHVFHGMKALLKPCFKKRLQRVQLIHRFLPQWHSLDVRVKRLEQLRSAVFKGKHLSIDFKYAEDWVETDNRVKVQEDSVVWEQVYSLAVPVGTYDAGEWPALDISVSCGPTPRNMRPVATGSVELAQGMAEKLLLEGPQDVFVDLEDLPEASPEDPDGDYVEKIVAARMLLQVSGHFHSWRGADVAYDSDDTTLSKGKFGVLNDRNGQELDRATQGASSFPSTASRRVFALDSAASDESAGQKMSDLWEAFDGEDEMWDCEDEQVSNQRLGHRTFLVLCTVIILYTLYPLLIERNAEMFHCHAFDYGDGVIRQFLIADYRIDCSSSEYTSARLMAIMFTCLYGLGIPIFCMACIGGTIWYQGYYHAMRRWAFLTRALREKRWYGDVVCGRRGYCIGGGVFLLKTLGGFHAPTPASAGFLHRGG